MKRILIVLSGIFLLITGAAKFTAVLGSAKLLDEIEPILGISFRAFFIIAGAIECIVAILCILRVSVLLQSGLILWLSLSFAFYRFGLFYISYKKPCSCLGSITEALGISEHSADLIALSILTYLLLAGAFIFFKECHGAYQRSQKIINA